MTFKVKDYRIEGPGRYKTMTVAPGEFIRRFLLHVLPKGFHRIRHYGLLASSRTKADTIARARELIKQATPPQPPRSTKPEEAPPAPRRQTSRSIPARVAVVAWSSSRRSRRAARRASTDRVAIAIRIDTS